MATLAIVFILTFVASAIGAGRTLTVMAQSGAGGLTSVDLNVAINQGNTIAFTAVDSTGSSVFVVSTPGEATRIVDGLSDRSNMGVGITSGTDPIVAYRVLVNSPAYLLKETSVSGAIDALLGSSVSSSGPKDWDSITSNSIDINDNGIAVVSALTNGSTITALCIGNSRPLTQAATFPGAIGLRPEISDAGEAVIRDNTGRIITWFASGVGRFVAGTSNGFDINTGNRPGITKDGTGIAFSGNQNGTGAGIYALVTPTGLPATLVKTAGADLGDGFTSFTSEQRVGIRAAHSPSESGGAVDVFTVVFQASLNGIPGVYTKDIVFTDGQQDPLEGATTLVQNGSMVGAATVTGFTLYHPINDAGSIACTLNLSDGSVAVVRMDPIEGMDMSYAFIPSTDWANTVYDDHSERYFVQDVWTGLSAKKVQAPANNNFALVEQSKIPLLNVAAYAVINNNNMANGTSWGAPSGYDQTGELQMDQAFSVVGSHSISFMSIDAENNTNINPVLTPLQAVARYADAIWASWTRAVPAVIYTSKGIWKDPSIANNNTELKGIELWDSAPDGIPSLSGFKPYGPWIQRLGKQYKGSFSRRNLIDGIEADQDVFDPSIFVGLPLPVPGCKAGLFLSGVDLSHSTGSTTQTFTATIENDSSAYLTPPPICDALVTRITGVTLYNGTQVTSGKFNGKIVSSTKPVMYNTIPANSSTALLPLTFSPRRAIPDGTSVVVRLSLSCGGVSIPARSYHLVTHTK